MSLPLSGIKIIDLSRMLPGPYCSMILADLGADVIRVEDPSYPYSDVPPLYKKGAYSESAFNSILMRNKKSIAINLKKEESIKIFYKLIESADVVLESFRPGIAEKLKIDYKTISKVNKSIIYCSLTGYGQTGPYSQLPGHDLNYLSLSGFLNLNKARNSIGKIEDGNPPVVPGVQFADIGGAMQSAIAILACIIERGKNSEKKGQYIDISMHDCAFSFNPMAAAFQFTGAEKSENPLHGDFPFYTVYRTRDNKFLSIGAIEIKFWQQLLKALSLSEYDTRQYARDQEREEIFTRIQEKFLEKNQAEWLEIFKNYDTCVTPVNSFDTACHDPHLISRDMVAELDHPKFGKIKNINSPIKLSRTPLKIRGLAPKNGQDTAEILHSLSYSDDEIKELKKKGTFR